MTKTTTTPARVMPAHRRIRPHDRRTRLLQATTVAALLAAAVAHVPVIRPHLAEAPYMGVLFLLFTGSCVLAAVVLAVRPMRNVVGGVVLLSLAAIVMYCSTRTVAFPLLSDDVGNWTEPLGVVSLVAESIAATGGTLLLRGSSARAAAVASGRSAPVAG